MLRRHIVGPRPDLAGQLITIDGNNCMAGIIHRTRSGSSSSRSRSAHPDAYSYEGSFLFKNSGDSPITLPGEGEPIDGKFRPSFVGYQEKVDGLWQDITIGYSGLPDSFPMLPGSSHEFFVYLQGFREKDLPVTGRIGVGGILSEEFVLDWKRDRAGENSRR